MPTAGRSELRPRAGTQRGAADRHPRRYLRRSNLDTGLYQHYAVAGRIERDGILAGRFAWIARWPGEAEQFMKAALQANIWTPQTQVVVLADGADGLKNVVQAAGTSEPRSILAAGAAAPLLNVFGNRLECAAVSGQPAGKQHSLRAVRST